MPTSLQENAEEVVMRGDTVRSRGLLNPHMDTNGYPVPRLWFATLCVIEPSRREVEWQLSFRRLAASCPLVEVYFANELSDYGVKSGCSEQPRECQWAFLFSGMYLYLSLKWLTTPISPASLMPPPANPRIKVWTKQDTYHFYTSDTLLAPQKTQTVLGSRLIQCRKWYKMHQNARHC